MNLHRLNLCFVRMMTLCNLILFCAGGMSFKGVNYGRISKDTSTLALVSMTGDHPILSINYSAINNSTINKQDIIVETAAD